MLVVLVFVVVVFVVVVVVVVFVVVVVAVNIVVGVVVVVAVVVIQVVVVVVVDVVVQVCEASPVICPQYQKGRQRGAAQRGEPRVLSEQGRDDPGQGCPRSSG